MRKYGAHILMVIIITALFAIGGVSMLHYQKHVNNRCFMLMGYMVPDCQVDIGE